MMAIDLRTSSTSSNQLISRITGKDRATFISGCETVQLSFGSILCEPGQDYDYVYFPTGGFISLVVQVPGHPALEVGVIGEEGMLGATTALGIKTVPMRGIVQGTGPALRMSLRSFRRQMSTCVSLGRVMEKYQYLLTIQASRLMACSHYHVLAERLALWLMLTLDRSYGNKLELTHQFLADMLGVQRSAVTIASSALKNQGTISYQRGQIVVHSRAKLEQACCGCYQSLLADYRDAFATG